MKQKSIETKAWQTYEEVARHVLHQCAEQFGLSRFEGKQSLKGQKSGSQWEVDARGWASDGTTFVIVECKRHTGAAISQAITGSLAFAIQDTGASAGFLVSPMGLQKGGKLVAAASNITPIKLDLNSTIDAWFGEWLGSLRVGLTDKLSVSITERLQIEVRDLEGNIVETYDSDCLKES